MNNEIEDIAGTVTVETEAIFVVNDGQKSGSIMEEVNNWI